MDRRGGGRKHSLASWSRAVRPSRTRLREICDRRDITPCTLSYPPVLPSGRTQFLCQRNVQQPPGSGSSPEQTLCCFNALYTILDNTILEPYICNREKSNTRYLCRMRARRVRPSPDRYCCFGRPAHFGIKTAIWLQHVPLKTSSARACMSAELLPSSFGTSSECRLGLRETFLNRGTVSARTTVTAAGYL